MADRNEVSQSNASSTLLPSKVDPTSAKFEANMRFMADLVSQVRNEEEKIREGGGIQAKAAPLQALGKIAHHTNLPRFSRTRTITKFRATSFTRIFSFGKAVALRYFWKTTVNTSSTPTASARPSAGLFSVYFFYFWWGSNSF